MAEEEKQGERGFTLALAKEESEGTEVSSEDSAALVSGDEFTRYLNEIRPYPILSREEEGEVARRFHESGDRRAAERLVTGNLRLVVKIALEYRRAWVNVMDLIQEGNVGLAEAVRRFDPYRGVRFSSFARYWIRALILQYILKNFRMISFAKTRAGRKLFFQLERERNRLIQLHGEATTKQLSEVLEVSEEEIEAVTMLKKPTLSLQAPLMSYDGESRTLEESIPSEELGVEESVLRTEISRRIEAEMTQFSDALEDEREQQIWRERLVSEEPLALAQLGERFGVSRERVRQLEERLKRRFKEHLRSRLGEELFQELGGF